jgi:hypothetical protein
VGDSLGDPSPAPKPTLDLSPFSATRFAEGGARPEAFVV